MSENTVDQNAEEAAVLPAVPSMPLLSIHLSKEEIMTRVQGYKVNAELSLQRIKENESKLVEQLNKLQQMRLMLLGQLELVNDLVSTVSATPALVGEQSKPNGVTS
jgi:hypothetical protein